MKLVNRVSAFFLAALAVVLIVYSGLFYAFVRARLTQQFDLELRGALGSLVAAVEIEPEEVKWQPLEHAIDLGAVRGPDEVQWAVIGDTTRVVEQSRDAAPEFLAQAKAIAASASQRTADMPISAGGDWHLLHQRVAAPSPEYSEREPDEFDEITVVVAHSASPLKADLRRLLLLVCGLPVGTWVIAAAAGHWFCRRALQPVSIMSQRAGSLTGADFDFRLPVLQTGDELADLAVAFNSLLDHQRRAFEQQRRFTGDAAHELRTPLTVLLGQIDVALRRTRSPEEYSTTLRVLRDQTTQLQAIVESLLFLARAQEDASLPGAEAISLAAWLPTYLNRWEEHSRRNDIHLQFPPVVAGRIKASPALLCRLLDNLIENALKYSEPGSRVDVTLSEGDNATLLAVQDQGRGIAAEDQAEIFQPFFRSQKAREAGIAGTGLGLAIAARIAVACGGRLDCTSEIGRGSRFTLRLPNAAENAPA